MRMIKYVLAFVAAGIPLSVFADEGKWNLPNVVGMPGYHENAVAPAPKSEVPTWDAIAGNWKQITGKLKQKWGNLTDDEIAEINGKREQLEGRLQAHYGYSKEQAQSAIDEWLKTK